MSASAKSLGIIIIGDEILKGHATDQNAPFLLNRLWAIGVDVKKVSFIPDTIEIIAEEVRVFSDAFDFVITTGGVGPTHDDLTYQAVAAALNESLVINYDLRHIVETTCSAPDSQTSSMEKMFLLPKSAQLIIGVDPFTDQPIKYPLVFVKNIYIFPGVPEYMQKAFICNENIFSSEIEFHLIQIFILTSESKIVSSLEKVYKMNPGVQIGSYPVINNKSYNVKVTLESCTLEKLDSAYRELIRLLPQEAIVSVRKYLPNSRDKCMEIFHTNSKESPTLKLKSFSLDNLEIQLSSHSLSPLSSSIKSAWAVLKLAYGTFSTDEICLGFTGGKDCTVVLHLMVALHQKLFPKGQRKILGLYLKNGEPFQEAKEFIDKCVESYHLQIISIDGSIKNGLTKLKTTHPKLKAIVMGTRRHDPYSAQLKSFSMTDPNWPQYMRVLPILDWSYSEIWQFLSDFELPYCELYDKGYSSVGALSNTHKNPELLQQNGQYAPARSLGNEIDERKGRI